MKIRFPRRILPFILTGVLSTSLACTKDKKQSYKTTTKIDDLIGYNLENQIEEKEEDFYIPETSEIEVKEEPTIEEVIMENLTLYRYVVAKTNVNIRSKPSIASEKLGKLFEGQYLPLINDLGYWCEVSFDGKSAFISSEYLEKYDSYESMINKGVPLIDQEHDINYYLSSSKKIRATATVNVRSSNSTNSKKLDQLKKGDELPLISIYDDEWYQVNYNGQIAYVFREYAKEVNSYKPNGEVEDIIFMNSRTPLYSIDNFEIIKYVPKLEIAQVYAQDENYYLVDVEGTIGFIEKIHAQSLGDKYIIIDISSQNMKVYVDDKVIVDTPVVTGGGKNPTYCGVFDVYKKETNITWPEFNVTVECGLAFNRGAWIHPAKRRNEFGGNIYKKDPSHGCVNTPDGPMKITYEEAEIGTPVLVKK